MKTIKSNKQRRAEIRLARQRRRERRQAAMLLPDPLQARLPGRVLVCPERLRPSNSYGDPEFVRRGYYEDLPFRCVDCGAEGVWSAERQRWWYEVAKGDVFTTARRCAACRAAERERRIRARQVHLAGLMRKAAARR